MAIRADAHRDEQHRDQQWHKPCRVATTANITISTALNNGDTLDGVTLATGDRVLVKDQSSALQNGIYVVGASPARAYDMLAGIQALGAFVWIIAGTANGAKLFKNTNTTLPTINTDALTFTEFSGGSGAPTNADYLVGTANGSLSAEIVVGTTPGGELGGTWASPTVDSVHSGSAHVALTANTPQAVSTAGAVGSGTASAKDDHVHAHEAAHIQHDTTWAAKGDLIVGTANDAASILTVGSNDQIPMADSGQSTGLKWVGSQTPSTQAFSDSAAEGTADTYARGDHKHGMPADPGGSGGTIGTWQSWTPVWASSGTAPSLGNGTLTGRYLALGTKTYVVTLNFIRGSTSTNGTGTYKFTGLPFTSAAYRQIMSGTLEDSGTAYNNASGFIEASSTQIDWASSANAAGNRIFTGTAPQTLATSDQLALTGIIEAA